MPMTVDDERTIDQMQRRGWYDPCTGLSDWAKLAAFTDAWKKYILVPPNGESVEITARDDAAAKAALQEKFDCDPDACGILERITTIRRVQEPNE